ncbi:unnamed protein product [Ixodes persulcatus]
MWTRLAGDIGEKLNRARAYALPLAERRYLAYSVFCGRLWYLAQAALPTSRFIRRVKSALFSFFWSEKTELVTRPVVCLPRECGGWGFPCVDIAPTVLHLKTTVKILLDEHGPARSLALYCGALPPRPGSRVAELNGPLCRNPAARLPKGNPALQTSGRADTPAGRRGDTNGSSYRGSPGTADFGNAGGARRLFLLVPPHFFVSPGAPTGLRVAAPAGASSPAETACSAGACRARTSAQTAGTAKRTCTR